MKTQGNYKSILDLRQTEIAIKIIKDFFEKDLSAALNLMRVTAPLFVLKGTGINDDLNGSEEPVSFFINGINENKVEIVQSLAKWKRLMLKEYGISTDEGILTDMNAIRKDEKLDCLHSAYVDQWDWEKRINESDRNIAYLVRTVKAIYSTLKKAELLIEQHIPELKPILPEDIFFIQSEELRKLYPDLTPPQRENKIAAQHKAVFIIGIGAKLADGEPHDMRAPDYDDWSSETQDGYCGLNGDIIVWNPVLECAFELSSMGIRVNEKSMQQQLSLLKCENRSELMFHSKVLAGEVPPSIGGGIGQSRLCMFYLRKAHIGEVQASIWPKEMIREYKERNVDFM